MDVTSSDIYKTIDWYSIPENIRVDIGNYIESRRSIYNLTINDSNKWIWLKEWNAGYKSYSHGWYLHFHDSDGYTRFVLQWL